MREKLTLAVLGLMVVAATYAASGAQRIPLDLAVQAMLESTAERFGEVAANTTARYQQNAEYSTIAAAKVAAVGLVHSPVGYRGHRRSIMTKWQLHVDEAVYGCAAGDTLVFSVMGGSVDGTARINSLAPSLWDKGRFLVLMSNSPFPDSVDHFVGTAGGVYHIREGLVERKGLPLSEFTPIVRDILADREPKVLFSTASDVVVGTALSVAETTEFDPYKHKVKVVPLEVSESLKGSSVAGDTLAVRVPDESGVMLYRRPKFTQGEWVLVFLMEQSDGTYRVLEDTAGKYTLEFADMVSARSETPCVLEAMRALSGGQPN